MEELDELKGYLIKVNCGGGHVKILAPTYGRGIYTSLPYCKYKISEMEKLSGHRGRDSYEIVEAEVIRKIGDEVRK